MEEVADALREWINQQPIVKGETGDPIIAPVYNAHVLLCELIRERLAVGAAPPAPQPARDEDLAMIDQIRERYPRVMGQSRTRAERDIHYLIDYAVHFKELSDRLTKSLEKKIIELAAAPAPQAQEQE